MIFDVFLNRTYSNMKMSFESCAKLMMFETIIIIEKGKGVNIIYVYAWDPLQERTGIFLSKQKKKARFTTTCEKYKLLWKILLQ